MTFCWAIYAISISCCVVTIVRYRREMCELCWTDI